MLPTKTAQMIRDQFSVVLPTDLNEAFRKVFQSVAQQAQRGGFPGTGVHSGLLATRLQEFYREQIEAAFKAIERVLLKQDRLIIRI